MWRGAFSPSISRAAQALFNNRCWSNTRYHTIPYLVLSESVYWTKAVLPLLPAYLFCMGKKKNSTSIFLLNLLNEYFVAVFFSYKKWQCSAITPPSPPKKLLIRGNAKITLPQTVRTGVKNYVIWVLQYLYRVHKVIAKQSSVFGIWVQVAIRGGKNTSEFCSGYPTGQLLLLLRTCLDILLCGLQQYPLRNSWVAGVL